MLSSHAAAAPPFDTRFAARRAFRAAVRGLHGKRLGCFCDEADPCHAKVLAKLAAMFASEEEAERGAKRKREEAEEAE